MTEYLLLFVSAAIVNNFVLTRFLGLCIFFGVSKRLDASVGMGMAVTSVITLSSMLAWVVYTFVLVPLDLTFLKPLQGMGIAFILTGMLALSFLGFSGMIKI